MYRCRIAAATTTALALAMFVVDGVATAVEVKPSIRADAIKRAQVWESTDIPSMDLAAGPKRSGAFKPGDTVVCDYVEKKMTGHSPKFTCVIAPDDEVKLKFGRDNGEVYGEVAATRLLWALGFGADAMYPVKVLCHKCPPQLGGTPNGRLDEMLFDTAAIERKMPGHDIVTKDHDGWKWDELDQVSEAAGGAPLAHRDALKLLAVLIQHSDSKEEQQRLACQDKEWKGDDACAHPFMLINDLGLTFGKANMLNRESAGSVNFAHWSRISVWKEKTGCVANLAGSYSGTIEYPRISEGGRAFLAGLLTQLTDKQLDDLFETARFYLRPRDPNHPDNPSATVGEWREAFKQKRDEIVNRRCDVPPATKR